MVVLALLLLALAVLLTIGIVVGDSQPMVVDVFGVDVRTSTGGLFTTGIVIGVVVIVAIGLLRLGLKRGWRRHQKIKDLERRAEPAERETPAAPVAAADDPQPGTGAEAPDEVPHPDSHDVDAGHPSDRRDEPPA